MRFERALAGLFGLGLAVPAGTAQAGGFLLQEQSQLEIGRAFSGGAASADGPSTVFYNPAGMTELEGFQISTGVTALFVDSAEKDMGTTRTGPGAAPTQAVGGTNGGNPFASVVPVPTTYATWQVGDGGLWLGFGLSAPFGLKLRYDKDFFGRYNSIYSNLLTLNAQPSIAYKLNDAVSLGGGLDIQYADATLTSALPPLTPGDPDGVNRLSGDDISLGWNAGILVKLDSGVRLGLHYRSGVTHSLKGDYEAELGGATMSSSIRARLSLPDSATASVSAPVGKNTRLMATGRFYNWSRFRDVRLDFASGASGAIDFNYKDSWSLSAGIDHEVNDRLTLRGGAMFDKTPTNSQFLSTRVPDGDRSWASMGVSYRLNDHMVLNASYAHVFIQQQTMVRPEDFYSGAITVTTRARNSGNVDMIATSLTTRF